MNFSFEKVFQSVLTGLVLAGLLGMLSLNSKVTKLEAEASAEFRRIGKIENQVTQVNGLLGVPARLDRIETKLDKIQMHQMEIAK